MLSRHALISILLLAVGGVCALACDTAMIWDGAHQLALTLFTGEPYFYLSRFHSWILWQPVVWLEHFGASLSLLKAAYGFPFCLAPAISAALCWWLTRRTAPHLFLWAVFGVAIGTLPGQIFIINDSIFQVHMFWPVFLAVLVPLRRWRVPLIALLSLFQLSHPIGIGTCGLLAAGAAVLGLMRIPERRSALFGWSVWFALLAAVGIWKLVLWPDAYAAREATLSQALNTLFAGVLTWPLPGLLAMWTAAFLLVWKLPRDGVRLRDARLLAALLAGTGALWLIWGSNAHFWFPAINYRRWVVPVSLPFFAAAYLEVWRGTRGLAGANLPEHVSFPLWRGRVAMGLAAIFLLVLGAQSSSWLSLWHRLGREVAGQDEPILTPDALAWTKETPLEHWGIYSQVLILQGRQPHTLYLERPELAAARENPPRIAFSPFLVVRAPKPMTTWFRWETVLQRIRHGGAE